MKFNRRTFLAGSLAATAALTLPKSSARADNRHETWATLIDLTRCDGCADQDAPLCVSSCRQKNSARFPEPDPAMLKPYWPKDRFEDWSDQRDITWRLTPYNWLYVEEIYFDAGGSEQKLAIPRRCMHCDDPACVKLCPFGTAKKDINGPVHIDPELCFGGAKCRAVCPWNVPQRQAGVGPYTSLDPLPVGGGAMYKCDLCRDNLAAGKPPACISACPKKAMSIGSRDEIRALAQRLQEEYNGHIYGDSEHGGTGTLYVSKIPFETVDAVLTEDVDPKSVMRFHKPDNEAARQHRLSPATLLAPLAGAVGAFTATVVKQKEESND